MLKSQHTKFLFCGLALSAVLTAGCTKSPEIELRGPEKPQAPRSDTTTPSTGNNGSTNPDASPTPVATPVATPLPAAKYRALCDDRYPSYLTAISSLASSSGFGSDLDIQVWPADRALPVQGGFQTEDRNLEHHMFPQPIEIQPNSVLRLAFSAKPLTTGAPSMSQSRNVYVSSTAMVDRIGRAELVGAELPIDSAAQSLATKEGFQARTFSVSDQGSYLLLQDQKGIQFFSTNTLRGLGRVDLKSAANYFSPTFRESDGLLLASKVNSGKLVTEALRVTFKGSGEILKTTSVFSITDLRRPLLASGRIAGEVLYGIRQTTADGSEIVIVDSARSLGVETSIRINALPLKGRVASSVVVWRDQGTSDLQAAIGFESVRQVGSGFGTRYKVDAAFVRVLGLDLTTASAKAVGQDFEYPSEAIRTVEAGSASGRMTGIKDFVLAPDSKAIFALFPGSLAYQVYRFNSTGFERMSQEDCTNLSIGVEP